jgi:hypothetical protein
VLLLLSLTCCCFCCQYCSNAALALDAVVSFCVQKARHVPRQQHTMMGSAHIAATRSVTGRFIYMYSSSSNCSYVTAETGHMLVLPVVPAAAVESLGVPYHCRLRPLLLCDVHRSLCFV